jgi:hypothetical protein
MFSLSIIGLLDLCLTLYKPNTFMALELRQWAAKYAISADKFGALWSHGVLGLFLHGEVQSAFHVKVPAVGWLLWCSSGG